MVRIIDDKFLHTCPLTGLKLEGRGHFKNTNAPPDVLYIFPAIGSALLDMGLLVSFAHAEESGRTQPRVDLAGACRAAHECKQKPFNISSNYYSGPDPTWPKGFEEKRTHFLRLLYDTGGNERRPRTIQTLEDFPLAFADDAEQFHRIIESLLDESLIRYNDTWVVQGDWQGDIQTTYHNVLLTPAGKHTLLKPTENFANMPSNNFNFGDGAKVHFIQGDGAVQHNITGDNASVNVATGNQNTQTNQAGQLASLSELVAQLKQIFVDSAFDSRRDEINDELNRIEVQLQKSEPKKSIISRAFDYLKDMAADSAGAVSAQAALELIKHAPALIAAAHLG